MEIAEGLLQLQETHVNHAMKKIEDLGGNSQQSQPLVQKDRELKEFLKHMKYVFWVRNSYNKPSSVSLYKL